MDEYKLWTDEQTFARMMIDAYEAYGNSCTDYYYATASHAFDLLLNGGIVIINSGMVKVSSQKPVKIYKPDIREFV